MIVFAFLENIYFYVLVVLCPGVCTAVGVEDPNKISDARMTASSNYLQYYPYKGRINGETGWCQGTSTIGNDYLQVDMGALRTVCAVATQGKKNGSYVTSYKLSISTDGVNWTTYQEGNNDKVSKDSDCFYSFCGWE